MTDANNKFHRIPKAILRRISGFFSNIYWTVKWNIGKPNNLNSLETTGHLLIVKNSDYVRVARICISSFLFFNPTGKLIIHCDQVTHSKTKSMVNLLARRKQIEILLDQEENASWQFSKLKLILDLSGSRDFYMDADLKWNGPLPKLNATAFFVREFKLESKREYSDLLTLMKVPDLKTNSMKNTSFFAWNGSKAPDDVAFKLIDFWNEMLETIEQMSVSDQVRISLTRISEQLALSALIPDSESSFIKDVDSQFDGAFVESSYFGATGTRFGWMGITSK